MPPFSSEIQMFFFKRKSCVKKRILLTNKQNTNIFILK
ncbi:hypothetical protein CHCC20372_3964 [Bacillus paralicheniformis]|nr:hypothetical protein CHCC20372_3964 [Bacillus paralicheniformis]